MANQDMQWVTVSHNWGTVEIPNVTHDKYAEIEGVIKQALRNRQIENYAATLTCDYVDVFITPAPGYGIVYSSGVLRIFNLAEEEKRNLRNL